MTHHNQTKVLTIWFLNLPLDEYIDNKKFKVWILNSRPHEAQLEDQKSKKSSRWSSTRKKKSQNQQVAQKAAKLNKEQRKAQN
jgi:hypothetical protein